MAAVVMGAAERCDLYVSIHFIPHNDDVLHAINGKFYCSRSPAEAEALLMR